MNKKANLTKMNWHPEVKELLDNQNYQAVANYYEELVENNPDEISNYWYLGLAYLLLGKEEEAQLTWFTAFNEIDEAEIDHHTATLTDILAQEVDQQLTRNQHQQAWLIRSHIRELNPDDFINLLELVCLDIYLHNSDIDRFETWNLTECCQLVSIDDLPTELILKSLRIILCLPCPDSLDFAKFCLGKKVDYELIFAEIINLAIELGYKANQGFYAIDLVKLCLEIEPNNLITLNTLFIFYFQLDDYKNALDIAYKFDHNCSSLPEKILSKHQIIKVGIKSNCWDQVYSCYLEQINLIEQFINYPEEIPIDFVYESLTMICQPFLYIQDKPLQNRYLLNNISKIYHSLFLEKTNIKIKPCSNLLSCDRPLKIGYVGNTFKIHSVGWLCRWLINYQDKDKYPCYVYAINNYVDEITEQWFKGKATQFFTGDYTVETVVEQIQKDEIDILVDVDSLTFATTSKVMSLKPTPIQVTWLGSDASGNPNVDYFIADPYVLPDNAQDYYAEKIWRLPQTYLGIDGFEYDVPKLTREDLEIPADAVIYFNVQNALKRHPDIIHCQMKIIKAIPNGYFLIKGDGDQEMLKQLFNNIAEEEGVERNRLRFLERTATEMIHRANLKIADVVLDTYPYNGSTTTLETLWMEVPIVTRVGEQFAARNSYTYMMNAGITEGIAWSDEEYIEWGIKLGTDENLRKEISWKLKQSKKTSPLWNGKQFAREMENAYRQMWEIYLKENS